VCSLALPFLWLIGSLRHVLLLHHRKKTRTTIRRRSASDRRFLSTEVLPRPHLVAWEPSSSADRRQLQSRVSVQETSRSQLLRRL
jgi:hypothetical protein